MPAEQAGSSNRHFLAGIALPSRATLYFWLFALGFSNSIAAIAIRESAENGLWGSASDLFGVSGIIFAAIAAALLLLNQSKDRSPVGAKDLCIALLVIAAAVAPIGFISRIMVAVAAAYLFYSSAPATLERRSAAIALSICGTLLVAPTLIFLFREPIAVMDAMMVGGVTGMPQVGATVEFFGVDDFIRINEDCSSLHGISLAIVLSVALTQWLGGIDHRRVALIALGAAAVAFALNIVRLASLVFFPAHFDAIHVGVGAQIFAFATLLGMLAVCALGLRRA